MRKYMKPLMESELFVANEYVAACETYKFSINGVQFNLPSEPEDDSGLSPIYGFFASNDDGYDYLSADEATQIMGTNNPGAGWYYKGTVNGVSGPYSATYEGVLSTYTANLFFIGAERSGTRNGTAVTNIRPWETDDGLPNAS